MRRLPQLLKQTNFCTRVHTLAQRNFVATAVAPTLQRQIPIEHPMLLRSEESNEPKKDKEESQGGGRKVPSGFEKLLKRSKKGSQPTNEQPDKDKKQARAEQQTDDEGDQESTSSEKSSKSSSDKKQSGWQNGFGMLGGMPGDGGPRPELFWLGMFSCGMLYAWLNMSEPSKEISYQQLVQEHLEQNAITMITLCEDKSGENFKYRANIDTVSGQKFHLVLP